LLKDDLQNIRSTLSELDSRLGEPPEAGAKFDRQRARKLQRTVKGPPIPESRHKPRHCSKRRELTRPAAGLGVSGPLIWEALDPSLPPGPGFAKGTTSSHGSRHSSSNGSQNAAGGAHSSRRSKSSAAAEGVAEEEEEEAGSGKHNSHSSAGSAPNPDEGAPPPRDESREGRT
jgi:hypothetical protein